MFYPINLTNLDMITSVLMLICIYLILYLIGVYFMNWYGNKKGIDIIFRHSVLINSLWFFVDLILAFFFFFLFRINLFVNLLIIVINIILGFIILFKMNNMEIRKSIGIIVSSQILLFVVALNLGLLFGIGENIVFFLPYGFVPFPFMITLVVLLIGFLEGYGLMKYTLRNERWENTELISVIVNSLWLVMDLTLMILFLSISLDNIFLNFILIGLTNISIGIAICKFGFLKNSTESLKQMSIIQTYVIISLFPALIVYVFFLVVFNFDIGGSGFTFFISIIAIFGVSVFFSYWGDKIQLIGHEKLFSLLSFIPGAIFITSTLFSQLDGFFNDFVVYIIIGSSLSILTGYTLKVISYVTIPYHSIRDLVVLEKGRDLLEIENIKVYYPLFGGILKRQIGAVKAVDGISFSIKTGETIGLVGESGCGKTTVAKAILGLIDKEQGIIKFKNKPIPKIYSSYLRQKIQIVFQDPDASLNPRMKVVDIIAEPLRNLLGITSKQEIRSHVLRLMDEVSLKREHMDRYPHEFSGGQKQRIIIARALACNPELIILDEPTSALDVSVQAQILNLLKDLQASYGYGYLFITHNLAVVNHIADRIEVMYLGKIVEEGNTNQIFSNPSHPYTQALLASRSEIDPFNQNIKFVIQGEVPSPISPPPGCTFNPRCVSDARTPECEFELPHKIKIEEGHYIWCINPPTGIDILEETE